MNIVNNYSTILKQRLINVVLQMSKAIMNIHVLLKQTQAQAQYYILTQLS